MNCVAQVGDHVKVLRGRYTGETGVVLHVTQDEDRWVAVLYSDTSAQELKVFVTDLQLTTEVSTGRDSLAGYELHDLVQVRITATV